MLLNFFVNIQRFKHIKALLLILSFSKNMFYNDNNTFSTPCDRLWYMESPLNCWAGLGLQIGSVSCSTPHGKHQEKPICLEWKHAMHSSRHSKYPGVARWFWTRRCSSAALLSSSFGLQAHLCGWASSHVWSCFCWVFIFVNLNMDIPKLSKVKFSPKVLGHRICRYDQLKDRDMAVTWPRLTRNLLRNSGYTVSMWPYVKQLFFCLTTVGLPRSASRLYNPRVGSMPITGQLVSMADYYLVTWCFLLTNPGFRTLSFWWINWIISPASV